MRVLSPTHDSRWGVDVVHAGEWMLPDERPPPAELEAFLDARTPPTTATGSTPSGALLAMATRFVTSVKAPSCPPRLPAISDRS